MQITILNSRQDGEGHISSDFALETPEGEIEQTSVFQHGVQIEREILGSELVKTLGK